MYGRDGRRLGGGRPHSRLREWDPGTPALTLVRPYRDVGCRIFNVGGVIDPAPPEVWIKNKKSLRSRRLSGKKISHRRGAEDAERGCVNVNVDLNGSLDVGCMVGTDDGLAEAVPIPACGNGIRGRPR